MELASSFPLLLDSTPLDVLAVHNNPKFDGNCLKYWSNALPNPILKFLLCILQSIASTYTQKRKMQP